MEEIEKKSEEPWITPKEKKALGFHFMLAFLLIIVIFISIKIVVDYFLFSNYNFTETIINSNGNWVGIVLIFLIGCALYAFRRLTLFYYGASEIGFALFTAYFAISKVSEPIKLPEILGVVAAIYLVVRGLDNMFEAIEKEE